MAHTKNSIEGFSGHLTPQEPQNKEPTLSAINTKADSAARKALKRPRTVEECQRKWNDMSGDKTKSSSNRKLDKIYDTAAIVIDGAKKRKLDPSIVSNVLLGIPRQSQYSSQKYIQDLRKALKSVGVEEMDPELESLEKTASEGDGLKLR